MSDPNPSLSDGLPGEDPDPTVGPEWYQAIKALGMAIAAAGSNPQEWLENFIKTVILDWIVGGILDAAAFVLGWISFAFERTASILNIGGMLTDPLDLLGDAIVGAIEQLYGGVYSVAVSAGLAAPLAAAFAVTVVLTVLAVVVFAVAKVIPGSDFVEGGLGALR